MRFSRILCITLIAAAGYTAVKQIQYGWAVDDLLDCWGV